MVLYKRSPLKKFLEKNMFRFLTNTPLLILLFVISLGLGFMTYKSIVYEKVEPDLMLALEEKVQTLGYLDDEIAEAIETEKFDDVLMYQNLAKLMDINLSNYTLRSIKNHNDILDKSWRNIQSFSKGFISGESDSMLGISGSITSDMTLYGDLRDIKKEGTLYIEDKPYDTFILSISMIGVGLSASQLLSAGTSTPLKIGASIIKLSKKTGNISQSFIKIISQRFKETVNISVLKKLDFSNIFKLKSTIKSIEKNINIVPIQVLLKDIHKIQKQTSTGDIIKLIQYVDTPKELAKIVKVSQKFKGNTKGVFKVLGKRAIFTLKTVVKYTMKFFYYLFGFFFSLLLFIIGWIVKLFFLKRIKKSILL